MAILAVRQPLTRGFTPFFAVIPGFGLLWFGMLGKAPLILLFGPVAVAGVASVLVGLALEQRARRNQAAARFEWGDLSLWRKRLAVALGALGFATAPFVAASPEVIGPVALGLLALALLIAFW